MPPRKSAAPGPKPRGEAAADQMLQVRVTPAEIAAYRRAADRLGMTLSDWIREAASVHMGEESPTPSAAVKLLADLRRVIAKHEGAL